MRSKLLTVLLTVTGIVGAASAEVTLEECVELACNNYPLIAKYHLLENTTAIALSDINKSWLPEVTLYGQGTAQSAVPTYPEVLDRMLEQMGTDMPGMGKMQYKVGVDVSQTIWDGGASSCARYVQRRDTEVQRATLDVEVYAVRARVENLYFGILLLEEQIKQISLTRELIGSNLQQLKSMLAAGVAMQCDVDMTEAQYLTVGQRIISAKASASSLRTMLGIFTGKDMAAEVLARPVEAVMPDDDYPERPEMRLFDTRALQADARLRTIRATVMPRVGLFAQAYYGYPGLDYFKSMSGRDMTINFLGGIKVTWNIGSLYTRCNNERRVGIMRENIAAERETFLYNIRLQSSAERSKVEELREIIGEDGRIVELRENVRRAAESQLANGVIDVTALLTKITDENQARLMAAFHEIELLQAIYQLKYTLNR